MAAINNLYFIYFHFNEIITLKSLAVFFFFRWQTVEDFLRWIR